MPKLTKRLADNAETRDSDYVLFDDSLPGFGLRVYPSGRKSWIIQYRADRRRWRRMVLGQHGVVTADAARKRAVQMLAEVAQGADPAGEQQAQRNDLTLSEFCDRVIREHSQVHCKPSTVQGYKGLVKTYIAPRLGDLCLFEITRSDIARFHHDCRYAPYQANRSLQFLSKAFNLAEIWGLRPEGTNPCRHIKKYKEEKRERYLSRDELARLGETLRECEEEGLEGQSAIDAIRLLALTGCRLSEIQQLRWEHVDLEAAVLNLPDSKTGAKTVYLGAAACAALAKIERNEDNPHVIPGKKPGSYLTDLQHPWRRIRKRAGLDDVRLHDLRHTFASIAVSAGNGLPIIGKLLGHTQVQTTARYAHLASDPLRNAANQISRFIAQTLT
ncbi:MAG: site-specific integrase [Alphaproteobacteria bacterium]